MHTVNTRKVAFPLNFAAAALVALALLGSFAAPGAMAAGAGQIVFVSGRAEHCKMGACPTYDLVKSISPHGHGSHVLAKVRSVKETASTEDGTVAVLSKNVAGGGANSGAYTQIYLLGPNGKRTAVFRNRLDHFNATGLGISGNGKWLALSGRYTEGHPEPSKIWLVRADGTGMRQLTTGPGSDDTPALSPDGKHLVFSRTLPEKEVPGSSKPELYVVGTEGGEPVRLTENVLEDVNPVFSPDGRSIAFGQVAGRYAGTVATIRSNGTGLRTVVSTGGTYPDPDYSPSGKSIAFVGEIPHRRGYDTAIYTVRTSGGGRALVSKLPFVAQGLPQWTLRP
jgi:Tol biopolymer transport system component